MNCEACGHENMDGARFCAACGVQLPSGTVSEHDPLIGQVIGGRFRVTRVLGEGGMGVVYEGEQHMGSAVRKVAIKTLHPHLSKDPSVLARFHRECGTVAQLEHPNTIKVYDFGSTDDGTLYIAMEFVSGAPLSEALEKQGPFSPERVVKVMRQVCGALEEAHQQGVVHRDLKPENIVLTERAGETDFAKVLDFGIAGRTESADAHKEQKLTQQGMVLGTPPYMSPEQFTGKALDGRSDVYSLAVVAYEMLTKRLPFDAETPWEWATQHMTAQPKPLEEVVGADARLPEHMRVAIMKALSKNREERQHSVREFFQELSAGARMTVEREAGGTDAGVGSAATAAMEAVPDFSAGVARTAAMPGVSPEMLGTGAPVHGPPPDVAVAAAPGSLPKKGSRKGLLIGLAGLGAVVGLILLIVLLRPTTDAEETALGNIQQVSSSAGAEVETIAPLATAEPTDTTQLAPTGDKEPSGASQTGASPRRTSTSSGTTSSGTTSGSSSNPATTTTQSSGSSTQPSNDSAPGSTGAGQATTPSSGGSAAACDECIAAARSRNVPGAVSAYQRCTDAGKKRACQALVRARAPSAAQAAARNGNCAGAKAVINGAKAMGAASSSLDSALAGTSCN